MMRTIKFRGKRADNGEWVYGDLLCLGGGCIIYFGSKAETQTPDIPNSSPVSVELFNDEIAVVFLDTIGQFTGLTDCKSTPIYEGDIIRLNSECKNYKAEVCWNNEVSAYCIKFSFESYAGVKPLGEWMAESKTEVIGNIYDNSELLTNTHYEQSVS